MPRDPQTTLWWPMLLKWVPPLSPNPRRRFFRTHRWQVGWRGMGHRVYGITLHAGSLKVILGPQRCRWCGHVEGFAKSHTGTNLMLAADAERGGTT